MERVSDVFLCVACHMFASLRDQEEDREEGEPISIARGTTGKQLTASKSKPTSSEGIAVVVQVGLMSIWVGVLVYMLSYSSTDCPRG
jgi:hypothetical protein